MFTINRYKILLVCALLGYLGILILSLSSSAPQQQRHVLVDKILSHLEQSPNVEMLQEYQRWLFTLQQQQSALNTALQDTSPSDNTRFYLSMADAELSLVLSQLQLILEGREASPKAINLDRYTTQLTHIANTPHVPASRGLEYIQIVFAGILLAVCASLTYKILKMQRRAMHLKALNRRRKVLDDEISQYSESATIYMSLDGDIEFMDAKAEAIFSCTLADHSRMTSEQLLHHPDHTSTLAALQQNLREGVSHEFYGLDKHNQKFPLKVSTHIFTNSAGIQQLLLLIQDTSELKRAEEKSLQAQKMEALGQLTGGIAHDFNNLLLIIQGNLRLLEEDLLAENDTEKLALLDDALSATIDGAELTDRLLSFSRRQALQSEICDVNELCQNFLRLIGRTLGEETTISLNMGEVTGKTEVDAAQLQNALLNLALNARDAMPNGGAVVVATSSIVITDINKDEYTPELPLGEYACIAVRDSGTGISEAVRSKVFDPFFTTKQAGQGTGMGLSMVYGFAQQSRGGVYISSNLGIGTEVSLLLPCCAERLSPTLAGQATQVMPRGMESILIVEDDERVRKFTTNCLRSLGYATTDIDSADVAHELLSQKDHGFHALFCDMIMPGTLNGIQLADWVKDKRPEIKVLMTTGFGPASHGSDTLSQAVIYKPYNKKDLAHSLRSVIDAH